MLNTKIKREIESYKNYLETTNNSKNKPYEKTSISTFIGDTKTAIKFFEKISVDWRIIDLNDKEIKNKYIEMLSIFFFENKKNDSTTTDDAMKNARNCINQLNNFKKYINGEKSFRPFVDIQFIEDYEIVTKTEGTKKYKFVQIYERDSTLRNKAIEIHGTTCQVCGFNFENVYGELGKDYIEVHHLIPLNLNEEEIETNPKTDLACICSNCHRMFHRKSNEILSLDDLKQLVVENKK